MTQFLAVLSGLVISVMVLINSELSVVYGTALATVIIHVVGLALIGVITAFAKKPPRQKAPWYLLCGGFVGVFLTYSNIYTVTAAGVSLTVALGLLGQCILSLLIDSFGWFGVPRQRFGLKRIGGLVLIAAGATAMLLLDGGLQQLSGGLAGQPILAIVVMGVLGGASNVFSRMLNAGLADRVGVYRSTLVNYITGLALSALILLILRPALAAPPARLGSPSGFSRLGECGIIGQRPLRTLPPSGDQRKELTPCPYRPFLCPRGCVFSLDRCLPPFPASRCRSRATSASSSPCSRISDSSSSESGRATTTDAEPSGSPSTVAKRPGWPPGLLWRAPPRWALIQGLRRSPERPPRHSTR